MGNNGFRGDVRIQGRHNHAQGHAGLVFFGCIGVKRSFGFGFLTGDTEKVMVCGAKLTASATYASVL